MRGYIKKIAVMVCTCMLMCFCTACGPATEMTFTESDFSITLNSHFEKMTDPRGYVYKDKKVVVVAGKDSKQKIKDANINITSLNRYAILALKSYEGADNAFVRDGLNHSYCEFTGTSNGVPTSFYAAFYETETDYWLVLFGCETADYQDYQPQFANWASTVTVK